METCGVTASSLGTLFSVYTTTGFTFCSMHNETGKVFDVRIVNMGAASFHFFIKSCQTGGVHGSCLGSGFDTSTLTDSTVSAIYRGLTGRVILRCVEP
ncbi:hypothetical protein TNCT_543871 [Trichonephila clavata]|uniref:Uncharacterized protein n=1 Tax=Trichonephila clavata TaxID=2740835 RepID=A0A8X6J1I9_TRICU|nr:hypothetical protein TNCT_543871 [Trichonephila clavata]